MFLLGILLKKLTIKELVSFGRFPHSQGNLKEEDYKILYLYIIGEYKHREIAEILNLPLGTVTWKYKNSLKKLKKVLLEEEKKDAQ